jgi:hypothetical protein
MKAEAAYVNVEMINKNGMMMKDLALAIHGKNTKQEHWVVMNVNMDTVNVSCASTLFWIKKLDVMGVDKTG